MAVTVRIPTALRTLTGGADEISGDAPNVGALLDQLEGQHPGLKGRVCDDKGSVRRSVNIFVNEDDIRFLDGLDTKLSEKDVVSIIPAIAGGR
ncbi:MAG TPA: MoaD/ThiS family protein [Polyangiaceae bacterium LLY-WYZ-14_1]|jgi:molybdopterin synthase sulfur carrier subunit|nr:MoaD/ThiS family protein [Polyangiaceae bacterium LLY-WYZ-14_1]